MLEVKDLVKVYKTKGGAEVRALDGITLAFEEKGMVFLLGRSGSGKSTLLNVCGGLDSPDSGEIIVKGKSSKDFSAGDFDSYRNTYVGFIFQEYNILNEFSVEDNIALALELQGKQKDKAEIARILEQVDLTDFAKRKPNTLSGGQKQRVAIARALVKNPEIIMADEPTGALDSNTGKQVLDTLKKLSEDKLVIVVSHDREFAEEYGDRIIELKDGKVISDVVKSSITAKKESENVSFLEDNTLLIKSGVELSDKDIAKIKKIISSSKEDVLVSTNKEDISLYKKSAKIKDDNSKECFVEIDKQPEISESQDGGKFIKSKLKFKHAFKIGASGIKTKPFRFILTLFLSTVAFIMFGLLSCLMYYDADKTVAQSLYEDGAQYYNFSKSYISQADYYSKDGSFSNTYPERTPIGDEDIELLSQKFGDKIIKVTKIFSVDVDNLYLESDDYYTDKVYGFVESSSALEYIKGGAPQNENEVAISEFLYNSIVEGKLSNPADGSEITVNDYGDIILKFENENSAYYDIFDAYFKVSGVFKCDDVPSEFDALKTTSDKNLADKFEALKEERFYSYVAIPSEAYDTFKKMYGSIYYTTTDNMSARGSDLWLQLSESSNTAMGNIYKTSLVESYYDWNGNLKNTNTLAENEILINENLTRSLFSKIDTKISDLLNESFDYDKNSKYYSDITTYKDMTCYDLVYTISNGFTDEVGAAELIEMIKTAVPIIDEISPGFIDECKKTNLTIGYYMEIEDFKDNVKIAGFSFGQYLPSCLMSESYFNDYCDYCYENDYYEIRSCKYDMNKVEQNKYSCVFVPSGGSPESILDMINYSEQKYEDDSKFQIDNSLKDNIDGYSGMVSTLSDIFLWVGLVLAVFSMLLLFNFIAASISAKKKEIGILRAVGARGTDVFKIFFVEAAIVVIICVIVSILITGIMSVYINNSISEGMGIEFQMFIFGFESIITIMAIAIVTAFVSTFIPVFNYAKKKPVESIRAL